MFFGEYKHSLDGKNRFILPSRFREALDPDSLPKFFMTRGFDTCLALYTPDGWQDELNGLKNNSYFKGDVRKFQRLLYSRTMEVVCDRQGRILIPDKFKDEAKMDRDITVIGLDNKIEIWDRQIWQEFNANNHDSFELLAESLGAEEGDLLQG